MIGVISGEFSGLRQDFPSAQGLLSSYSNWTIVCEAKISAGFSGCKIFAIFLTCTSNEERETILSQKHK